jgi:hypothetical protein
MGRRGRGRKNQLDDLKEKRECWQLEETTLRFHSVRTRFERRCGPVVRQKTEWMSEWMNKWKNESVQTSPGAHKVSYLTGTGGGAMFRMGGTLPPLLNVYLWHAQGHPYIRFVWIARRLQVGVHISVVINCHVQWWLTGDRPRWRASDIEEGKQQDSCGKERACTEYTAFSHE